MLEIEASANLSRKSTEELRQNIKTKISKALSSPNRGRNKAKQELRVASVDRQDADKWLKRSLQSGSLLKAERLERYRVKIDLTNTCTPDTILQALAWQYIDDERFREIIDERIRTSHDDADVERFIAILAELGESDHIYRFRRELIQKNLFATRKGDVITIQAVDYFEEAVDYLVTSLLPAMTSTSNCKCRIETKTVVLPILRILGIDNGMEFKIGLNNERLVCRRCGQRHTMSHVLGDIVLLPWLYFKRTEPARLVKNPDNLPQTINLNGNQYQLACFFDVRMEGHLMVNCLRKDGEWYQYNNHEETAAPLEGDSIMDCLMYRKV